MAVDPTTIDLSDEQRLLRETVTGLAADLRATPESLDRALAADARGTLEELGLLAMRLPEAAGGADASVLDVVLVAEALASTAAAVPFAGPVLAAELVRLADPEPERLAELAAARLTIAVNGDTLEVAPPCWVAFDAQGASLVAARGETKGTVVVRPLAAGEDTLARADLTRVMATVDMSRDGERVGMLDDESRARWEAFALVVLAADLCGTMAGALELAVTHASDRRQFGVPIGSFQALAHLLADAHVRLESARSATRRAARALDEGEDDAAQCRLVARVAKAYASRVALEVTEAAVQVHGGIGTTWESPCHLFVRRALTGAALLGDEQRQLELIAEARLGAAR